MGSESLEGPNINRLQSVFFCSSLIVTWCPGSLVTVVVVAVVVRSSESCQARGSQEKSGALLVKTRPAVQQKGKKERNALLYDSDDFEMRFNLPPPPRR